MSRPPRDITEWMRFMEQEVKKAARSGQAGLARELRAEMVKVRDDLGTVDTRQPAAPIEFTIQTSVLSNPRPYSQLSVNFSDVTVATDASAITAEKYELWGRDETTWNGTGTPPPYKLLETSATSDFFSEPYAPGSKWRIKARAIGEAMRLPGVFSAEFLVTMVADTTAPKIVPNPDLSQTLGVVTIKWDGLAADNSAMDPDFKHVEIAMGASSAPTALLPDTFLGAGSIHVPDLPYGQPRYFRMRSVDWSGNKSNWSGDSSITRQPLVSGDISGLDTTIQEQTERAETAEGAALQAAADATAAQSAAATSAANATSAAGTATTAQQAATAAQSAADASAAEAAAAEAAAAQAAADAAAAEARILEVAGLGGRVWMETDAPSPGTTYNWTGTPQDSTSEMRDETGAVVRTNLAQRSDATVTVNKGWFGTGQNFTITASDRVTERGAGIVDWAKTGTGAIGVRTPTAAIVTNQPVTFSVRVKPTASVTFDPRVRTYPDNSQTVAFENADAPDIVVPANEWTTITRTYTIPTGTGGTQMALVLWNGGSPSTYTMEVTEPTIELGSVAGTHFSGATLDDRANDLWIDTDDGNKQYRWDGTAWVEAADENVAAAAEAAQAAQAAAATSASAATAAQTEATNAQNAANASASAANQAQAQAEAAAQAATASQTAAQQAANDADAAAVAAGSSSAAALAAEEAAEAANTAADAAADAVDAYIRGGDNMVVNGNFDAPITSPPLGWPSRTLTYNEASTTTARSGTQVLRATPSTSAVAYAYSDYYPSYTGQVLYIEYWVRLREALLTGNSAQQLGAYVSARPITGSNTVWSTYSNNGAAAVTVGQLSTTAWTKVAITQVITPADIKDVRFGPRIPALTTAGQNFEIDDFRAVDITHAKAALDAAATAQSTATSANAAAGAAQGTANSALTAANGTSKLLFSTDPPSGTAPYGTVWFQTNTDGAVIGQWQQTAAGATGGTWSKRDIKSETIANLDVGKLSGGFINSIHIETETLRVGTNETLADKLTTLDATATTVSDWDDGAGNIAGTAVVGLPASNLSGTISNTQIASGIDPTKLTGTGTVPTGAVPSLPATKITSGTFPAGVALPTGNLSGTVSNTQIATGLDPSKLTGTGTVPTAAVPALPTSKITNLDSSLTANATAATTAQQMAAYSPNPSFDDWTTTWPANYGSYSTVIPTKDATKFKIGTHSANFVTDATTSAGFNLATTMTGAAFPDLAYYTVEVGFMLNSGTLNGAQVLIDWLGYTNYRAGIRLEQAIPTPVLGKWYKVVATVPRPTTGGGTWTGMGGYLMANHDSLGATRAVKNINFDWFNVRPATDEEIKAVLAKQKVDSWASPSDVTYIDGGKLYTDSVKALQIDTNDLTADTGFVGSMKVVILTADSVDTTVLKSDAITSKHSITGALVQSTATAARGIKLTSTALTGFDGTGATMFNLSATTGKASIIGRVVTGATGEVGVGLIPAAESYNGKVAAVFITRDGSFPGLVTAGMWVEDASVNTAMNLNLRGHYGGHVEVIDGHLYVRGSGTRIGNFTNWAIGNSNSATGNYLPALLVSPSAGVTGYMRLANAPTSSSNANAIIAVSPEGQFYRSTSSLRYKSDVQAWTPRAAVMNLQPRTWVDRVPMDNSKPFTRYYGLIAEEVAEHLPEIITYNDAGQPESVQYDRLAVAILPTLRGLLQKVNAVDARVAALEAKQSGR